MRAWGREIWLICILNHIPTDGGSRSLPSTLAQGYAEVEAPDPAPSLLARAAAPAIRLALPGAGQACPFPATPLPLTPAQIGGDDRMVSVFAHESVLNCVGWGLFHAGALKTSVKVRLGAGRRGGGFFCSCPHLHTNRTHQLHASHPPKLHTDQDGELPGLRLITDLFGALMPDLPKTYPKHGVQLDVELTEPPVVAFADGGAVPPSSSWSSRAAGGQRPGQTGQRPGQTGVEGDDVLVSVRYTTVVSVLNATADGAPLEVGRGGRGSGCIESRGRFQPPAVQPTPSLSSPSPLTHTPLPPQKNKGRAPGRQPLRRRQLRLVQHHGLLRRRRLRRDQRDRRRLDRRVEQGHRLGGAAGGGAPRAVCDLGRVRQDARRAVFQPGERGDGVGGGAVARAERGRAAGAEVWGGGGR